MKDSTPGACESSPDRTRYPNREAAEATIEEFRAQGIPVWCEKCAGCLGYHVYVATKVYEDKLRKPA